MLETLVKGRWKRTTSSLNFSSSRFQPFEQQAKCNETLEHFSSSPGGSILALKGNFFMSFLLPILSRDECVGKTAETEKGKEYPKIPR